MARAECEAGEAEIAPVEAADSPERFLRTTADGTDSDAMVATLARIGEDGIIVELVARNICGPRRSR